MKRVNTIACLILILASLFISFFTKLIPSLESVMTDAVQKVFSSYGISIRATDDKYTGFSHLNYKKFEFEMPARGIKLSIDNLDIRLTKSDITLLFGYFNARFGTTSIESSDDSRIELVFDTSLRFISSNLSIPDLHASLPNGTEIYTVDIESEDEKSFSINTITAINDADKQFSKIETNYMHIKIDHLDLPRRDADVSVSFRFLPIKYADVGADFYDTSLRFSLMSGVLDMHLDALSFDIKNTDNVLLTLDNAKLGIANPNIQKNKKYSIDFESNILKFTSQADLDENKLTALLNLVRIEGINANLEFDFSSFTSPKLKSNIYVDTKISNFNIKGNTTASFENGRLLVAGEGFEANSVAVIPYADFNVNDKNKSVYFDIAFDSNPYCMLKLDFSDDESQFLTAVFPKYNYPIKVVGTRRQFDFSSSDILHVNIDYFNYMKIKADLNNFVIPARFPGFDAKTDTTINLSLAMELQDKNIKVSPSHIDLKVLSYFVSTDFSYNNNFLALDNIIFSDADSVWNAYASFVVPEIMDLKDLSCNISAFQRNGDGRIAFNATKSNKATDFVLRANEVSASFLRGFGISYADANINLRTDFKTIQYAAGNLQTRNLKGEILLSGDINFDGSNVNLYNASFEYNNMRFRNMKLSFDSSNMIIEMLGNISTGYWRFDRTLPLSTDIRLKLHIDNAKSGENLFANISSLLNPSTEIKGALELMNTSFDDLKIDNISTQVFFKDKSIKFTGSQLEGIVDFKDPSKLSLDIGLVGPTFPISGRFGFKRVGTNSLVTANIYNLNYALMTKLMMNPIINFYRGSLKGWAEVVIDGKDVDMKCSLHATQLVLDTLWLENERFITDDVNIVADGRQMRLKVGSAVAVNRVSGKANKIDSFEAGMYFENEDMIPHWYMDVVVPKDQSVQVNMPIVAMNYTIDIGKTNGHFHMTGHGMEDIKITGDLFADDVTMGVPSRAPDWFVKVDEETGETSFAFEASVDFDADITVGKNVSFSYPSPENALVNATLKENQTAHVVYTDATQTLNIDRDVEIERGEVFYFNRKFIIESGSFSWPEKEKSDFLGIKNNDMKINLFASLRDFDQKGNSIDLYINFKDASIGNLNPSFSASVPMEQSEVLYRFSQSIYNTQNDSTRDQYYTASASLLMDMAFAITSLRNAGSFSLGSNFAKELGIDVWTFRSQVISSFLAETSLFVLNNSYKLSNSVFSRFIDKTSINIGKKLNNAMILSFQLELRSITDPFVKNKGVELMPNFYCGINFSFEWMTPLARIILLSEPNDFSPVGFLSGLGLNITKTISF